MMIKKLYSKKQRTLALAIGLSLALGYGYTAEAAVQTAPLVVTDKDKVIDDDFNVKGHTYATAIYVDEASTGTVQVNSNTVHVENVGQSQQDTGVIDTGYGWNGTLNLKSGMQISGDFTGKNIRARGIQLNGFQLFTATDDTGNPYAGTAQLGDHISVSLTGNKATESAGLYGIEVDGENLQAGNGLSSNVSAHTGKWGEVFGMGVIHYGKAQIGDNAAIQVKTQVDGESTHLISDAVQTVHNWNNETYNKPAKGRQTLSIGKDAVISTEFHNEQNYKLKQSEAMSLRLSHTDFTLGDGAQIYATTTGTVGAVYGIYTDYHTNAKVGDYMTNVVTAKGRANYVIGLSAQDDANAGEVDEGMEDILSIGKGGKYLVSYEGDSTNVDTRGVENYGALVKLGEDNTIQTSARNTGTHGTGTGVYGIKINAAGKFEAEQGLQVDADADNEAVAFGIRQDNNSATTIKNHFTNTLHTVDTNWSCGVRSNNSRLLIGDDSLNQVQAQGNSPWISVAGYDIEGRTTDKALNFSLGNGARTIVDYEGGNNSSPEIEGLYNYDASTQIGDDASFQVTAVAAPQKVTYGIYNQQGEMTIGKNVAIQVRSPGGKRSYGIYNTYGTTELGDSASVLLDTTAAQNAAVFSAAKGNVLFDGGMKVQTGVDQDALSAKAEGSITALGEGTKQIYGNLLSMGGGTINLKLDTADSLLRGKSAVESAKNLSGVLTTGQTNLTLANGARWDMTGDSTVTTLDHENGGLVNMTYNPSYQNLEVGSYEGKDGIFLMKTDLDSQTNGDKVHMAGAASGSEGKIQVDDSSFLTGKEVTGTRHLLLVTDDSKNASFTGMTLDKGGLWDVTPTIQNGGYVREEMGDSDAKDTEWYLTKLTKTVNPGTRALLKSVDNTYALYRDSIDTLRQRMGDLRLRDKKSDVSGLWARNSYGSYAGQGVENKENRFQLGYDWSADRKSVYGILGERGIGNPSYVNGSGKDHSLAGAVYGTWFGDNGSYTDVVGKIGRDDAQVRTYGAYPDKADYRTHEASVSVEYGRTHKLNDKGLFLEPETQLVWGHLGNTHYTTQRGKDVTMSGYNSAIGRLGFVFGQRRTEIKKPFDYYLKANVLHEFGGDRNLHLAALDGETLDTKADYRDTWFELGLGGTARLNKATYLYADVSRTYGSDWNQKWRWNVGVDWTF